jgi:hypothetical protein
MPDDDDDDDDDDDMPEQSLDAQLEKPRQFLPAVQTIMGGPWLFTSCELRAAGVDVVVAIWHANVTLARSSAGGMGIPWENNGTMAACTGVHCAGKSVVTISAGNVEMCGAWGGAAVRCIDESRVRMKQSSIHANMAGLMLDDGSSVRVDACTWKDNQFGHLFLGGNGSHSALKLTANKFWEGAEELQSEMWGCQTRPGHLGERSFGVLMHERVYVYDDDDDDEACPICIL